MPFLPISVSCSRWLVPFCLLGLAMLVPGRAARAEPQPIGCAVDIGLEPAAAEGLCREVGRALKRPVRLLQDARSASNSEAFQLLRDDVRWTVVLLRGKSVSAYTRVSASDAQGKEARFIANALRALLRNPPQSDEPCVRVVPANNRSQRAPDLVYPWAELKRCVTRAVDVIDPWWK